MNKQSLVWCNNVILDKHITKPEVLEILLWLVNGSIEQFRTDIGTVAYDIKIAIEQSGNRFFVQA